MEKNRDELAIDPNFKVDDSDDVSTHSEFIPLFEGLHNPNHDIFVIPTLEGADVDDQWNGSIGDATVEHIYNMRHNLLEIENFFHMPNGNIFRIEQNVSPPDEDGQRALKNDIIKVMEAGSSRVHDVSKKYAVPGETFWKASRTTYLHGWRAPLVSGIPDKESIINFLKEEIALSKAAREEKMDAMDQGLVSFEDWEHMPQLTNSVDIPSTPTPLYIHAGNTSQMFYDTVPDDHPDLRRINSFLSIANSIEWDNFDYNTVDFFGRWAAGLTWEHNFARDRILQLCQEIADSNNVPPSVLAETAFTEIDDHWGSIVRFSTVARFEKGDPVAKEILEFRKQLKNKYNDGKLAWAEIGKFAQKLYKQYRSQMNSIHWNRYKELKKDFAPQVFIGRVDINSADMNTLRQTFGLRFKKEMDSYLFGDMSDEKAELGITEIKKKTEKLAAWVFFNRPFMTLEDVASTGIITIDDIGYNDKTVGLISMIKKAYAQAQASRNTAPLGKIAMSIADYQRQKPEALTEQEWYGVWQAYRICSSTVKKTLGL
jgi:hypothetical protein